MKNGYQPKTSKLKFPPNTGSNVPSQGNPVPMPPVKPCEKYKIELVLKHNNWWEVSVNGELEFGCKSQKLLNELLVNYIEDAINKNCKPAPGICFVPLE